MNIKRTAEFEAYVTLYHDILEAISFVDVIDEEPLKTEILDVQKRLLDMCLAYFKENHINPKDIR